MNPAGRLVLTTFSITARCSRTGMLGVAVCTAMPAVGAICPFVKPQVGAIASQSSVNPYLGIDGLVLLEQGRSAQQAVEQVLADDPGRDRRQLSVVDANGNAAAFTGPNSMPWRGHHVGEGYVVAANMMVDETTVQAMAGAFEEHISDALPERLLKALEAGDATGGDYRGRQSAALLVYHAEAYPSHSLRVDEHAQPVAELRRIFQRMSGTAVSLARDSANQSQGEIRQKFDIGNNVLNFWSCPTCLQGGEQDKHSVTSYFRK